MIESSMSFLKDLDSNLVISICAILISLISILIGVRYNRITFKHQKEHDKRTTEPHLTMHVAVLSDDGHHIELINNGFGPAFITSIRYIYSQKEYEDVNEIYVNDFPYLHGNIRAEDGEVGFLSNIGEIIASGESILLLKLILPKEFNLKLFIEFLKNIEIEVKYRNVYEDDEVFRDYLMNKSAYTGI